MSKLKNVSLLNAESFISALTLSQRHDFLMENWDKDNLNINTSALSEWINRTTVMNEELFEEMLIHRGFDLATYSNALDEDFCFHSDEVTRQFASEVQKQEWFITLNKVFEKYLIQEDTKFEKSFGYAYLISPFLKYAEQELYSFLEELDSNFITNEAMEGLINWLATKLVQIASKTFVLELNVSKLKKELVGETPQERFDSFIEQQGEKDNLISFYNEYSVLAKHLMIQTEQFVDNTQELFSRLNKNMGEISTKFNLESNFLLRNIKFGEGDTHQGGKTVAALTFVNGEKIMYKPKDLRISHPYNKLLEIINREPGILKMEMPDSLVYEKYSYEEFIEAKKCLNTSEVERYFQRFGQLLGVMYMINGNDFHMENVIASGEHPFIVDIETLFQSRVEFDIQIDADMRNRIKMQENVNNTLLIPQPILHNEVGDLIELSALAGTSQVLSKQDYYIIDNFTDNVRYELKNLELEGSNNAVYLNDKPVDYKKYVGFIIKGFTAVCQFFLKNKEELLKDNGVISAFDNMTIRLLLRNTNNYAELLAGTYHPDYMRDYYYLEQIIENTWALPLKNKKLIEAEYRDLMQGDIPIFFTTTTSTSIFDSEGKEFENCLGKTGMEKVKSNIINLTEESIQKQITIIQVKTGTVDYDKVPPKRSFKETKESSTNLKEKFIEHAKGIGNLLASEALICEKSKTASWITVVDDEINNFEVDTLGGELYEGLSGVSLFYHYLYEMTQEKQYKKLRDYTFNMAMKRAANSKYNSGLQGYASLLYPAVKVLSLGPGRKYKQAIQEVYNFLNMSVENYSGVDWMHGKSSIIELLTQVYEYNTDKEFLYLARDYANALMKEINEDPDKIHISGFSHGYSGIATALIKLNKYFHDNTFKEYGINLLNKESVFYNNNLNGWVDEQLDTETRNYWCRGSVGIGLSRLKLIDCVNDNEYDLYADISKSQNALNKTAPLSDDGLCHGNMGLVDFFLELYLNNDDNNSLQKALSIGEFVADNADIDGSYNLVSFDGFLPVGLFKGLAGIGYEFLRLANPHEVPSILTFN